MSVSRSRAITDAIARLNSRVALTEVAEEHGAVLTLTRSADQAITTAGTTITWQSALRNFQFTWATTNITMPATGWYHITLAWRTSAALNDMYVRLNINGAFVNAVANIGDVDRATGVASFMRYFVAGDVVQVNVIPSANVNLLAISESATGESPILNIVQISGRVNV